MQKNIFPIIIVIIFAFIAGLPLLQKGLHPTHDGEYHVVRFYEFDKTLRDGNWYPRWASDLNNGYGVPLFNYVYPLPNYAASFFHFLGFSFIDSFKLNMFFASMLGAVFFYLWSRGFWGFWGSLVGSVFYTFSPYHFVDIYIRGSVGEVWALAFFPAFLWAVTAYIRDKKQIFLPIVSAFLALIIFSHNILALMVFPFALSYCGFLLLGNKRDKGDKGDWGKGILIFLLGIGLSAIFWLPALFERQYVVGLEVFGFEIHFPDLYQLIIPSWGSGFSGQNIADQMSFQIGIANLVVVFLSLFVIIFSHSGLSRISYRSKRFWSRFAPQNDDGSSIIIFFLVWFLLIFFLMLKVSLPIWQAVPFMNYFQFPWRFLNLEILVSSFLAGSVFAFISNSKFKKFGSIAAILLILLSFSLGIGYAKPAHYLDREDNYYISRSNFIDGTNSPGNAFNTIWFDSRLKKEKEKLSFVTGDGKVKTKLTKSTNYKYIVEANTDSDIQINTAYFPGWSVFVDGKEISLDKTETGTASFVLNKGIHAVNIEFKNTLTRSVAALISAASFLLLLTILLFGRMKI